MMIRFFNHGDGSGAAAVAYLLAEEVAAYTEDRQRIPGEVSKRSELPEVLSGDPDLTRHLIDSNIRKWRYTSGVIAFHLDDNPSESQQAAVMNDFEKAAFAGLKSDQGNILWVRHKHQKNTELHFIIPRVELYRNRSFNPAPPGSERHFNTFRDYWNCRENWARPDDPACKRMTKPVFDFGDRKQIKEAIQILIVQKIEAGEISNHADVRNALSQLEGIEFKPQTNKQLEKRRKADALEAQGGKPRRRDTRITMRVVNTDDSQNTFRLEDRIFHEDWTADEYFAAKPSREGREAVPHHRSSDARSLERLRAAFSASVEQRAEKNRARYAQSGNNQYADSRSSSISNRKTSAQDPRVCDGIRNQPHRMAYDHMENDATDLSSRGIIDILAAHDGGTFNISYPPENNAPNGAIDIRPTRDEGNTWPWRFRPRNQPASWGRIGGLPNPKPRSKRNLHQDINNEVNYAPYTTNPLRDRTLARCRRTEYHLRKWFENRKLLTEGVREFEARIQSVRNRVREALERIAEATRGIEATVKAWLITKPQAKQEPRTETAKPSAAVIAKISPSP